MIDRLLRGGHTLAAELLVGGLLVAQTHAGALPPEETFFPPASLIEGFYPAQPVTGDGDSVPWTALWSISDIEALDPDRVDIRFTGMQILPLLLPNPETVEGEYSDEALELIDVGNFWWFYAHLPTWDIEGLNGDYDAWILEHGPGFEDDQLRMRTVRSGLYAVRVRTMSRGEVDGDLEPRDYLFNVRIADEFGLDVAEGENQEVPTGVHRLVLDVGAEDDESGDDWGGLAGPPGRVHIVSENDPTDNGFLDNATSALDAQGRDPRRADTVQRVIDEVCAAAQANGGPVELFLYGHGTGPNNGVANGRIKIGNERICNAGPNCVMTPTQFGEAIRGKVSRVVFYSCFTGSDANFLQQVANAADVPVSGYSRTVTAGSASTIFGWVISDAYLNTDGRGRKNRREPQGCKSGACQGDLNGDGFVDGADLGIMLRLWGRAGCADLNDDSTTDGADIGLLFAAWGPCG